MSFDIDRYLNRLGIQHAIGVNEKSLFDIQTQQLKSLTFENIDCLLDRDISTDPIYLQKKMIENDRGGYCFELNQILLNALIEIGFNVRPLLSRVMYRGTGINPKTHILLLATLNNKKFLVDAGFGGPGLFSPMPFELNRVEQQVHGQFKIEADQEFSFILKKLNSETGEWARVFAFTEDLVYPADLEMSNFYTSKVPTSHFRHNLIAALFTNEGRYTLLNRRFSFVKNNGQAEVQEIETEKELLQILTSQFRLKVPTELSLTKYFQAN